MVQLKSLKISVLRECVQRFLFETPHIDHQYCQSEVPKLSKKQSIEYLELYSVGFEGFQSMSPLSFVEPKTVDPPMVESPTVVPPTVDPPTVEPLMLEHLVVEHLVLESVKEESVTDEQPVAVLKPLGSKPPKDKKTRKREATVRKGKAIKAVVKFD